MRRRSLNNLREKAKQRPPEYIADVEAAFVEVNEVEGWYTISDEDFDRIRKKYASLLPGDWLAGVFASIGIRIVKMCGCDELRKKMNTWGWRGCFFRLPWIFLLLIRNAMMMLFGGRTVVAVVALAVGVMIGASVTSCGFQAERDAYKVMVETAQRRASALFERIVAE